MNAMLSHTSVHVCCRPTVTILHWREHEQARVASREVNLNADVRSAQLHMHAMPSGQRQVAVIFPAFFTQACLQAIESRRIVHERNLPACKTNIVWQHYKTCTMNSNNANNIPCEIVGMKIIKHAQYAIKIHLSSTLFAVFGDAKAMRDSEREKRGKVCALIVHQACLPAWSCRVLAFLPAIETENPKQNTERAWFVSECAASNRREGQPCVVLILDSSSY